MIFLRELKAASQFPDLKWRWHNDIPILKGNYNFQTDYKEINFQDCFNLEFIFPSDYPESIPYVKEIDNKIPSSFHHFTNGYLCLGAPSELWLIFSKKPTLENYITNLLNPYLLSWLWFKKFNKMPWGERQHGSKGIIESYQELLKLNNPLQTVKVLGMFIFNKIDNRGECPCGSGLQFRKCHKTIITKLTNRLPIEFIMRDFGIILGE